MRTVVGLFEDKDEARRTMDDLGKIGVRESDVSLLSNEGARGPMTAYFDASTGARDPKALLDALERMGLSRAEAQQYMAGIQEGYTLESVAVDDARANEALEIMRGHALGTRQRGTERRETRDEGRAGGAEEQILPIIVEELDVAKREVPAGGVMARSTVESAPVEEDVSLRTERIDVERRPADRPVQPGDDAFREREVEVTATAEEPIVGKTARVVEEVVISKDVDTRTETVRDTVRRTDVELERIPYDAASYRGHYTSEYGGSGTRFEEYEPAYRFGYDRREPGDEGDWSSVEPNARADWEKEHPNTWERFKAAVRRGWERTKG